MSAYETHKALTIINCKLICQQLGQPESLHMEKYNRLVKMTEKSIPTSLPYMSPEVLSRKVYETSLSVLDDVSIRTAK